MLRIRAKNPLIEISGPDSHSSNPLIVRSVLRRCFRSGWHLPSQGVAVASQILCISTTLNKRNSNYIQLSVPVDTIHHARFSVNRKFSGTALLTAKRSSDLQLELLQIPLCGNLIDLRAQSLKL